LERMNELSAQELLQDPVKMEFFKNFLQTEESNDEILFYIDVEQFNKNIGVYKSSLHNSEDIMLSGIDLNRAEAIYNKYLRKNSPYAIKISENASKNLDKAFKQLAKSKKPINMFIFDEAKESIIQNLQKEQLPRFMKSMFYITMYNNVTTRKPYELPEQVFKEFLLAAEGGVEEGWTYESETKGILIHKKQFLGEEYICVRGSGVVPLPIEEMHVFATSMKLRQFWDFKCTARIIQNLDDKTVVAQYEYKPPKWAPMYNNQDFVVIRTEKTQPDGTIVILSRSIIHKDAPPRKGYTRSEVECSGFILRSCGNNSTVVVYVSQAKMNGVPKWAEAKLCNKRALLPYKIRKFVEKELKDKKKVPVWKEADIW